jgi:hypothetical protein
MDPFKHIQSDIVSRALRESGLQGVEPSELDAQDQHKLMTTIAKQLMGQATTDEQNSSSQSTITDWMLDQIDDLVKNHIAIEVYEKTLSHKVMPTEDWKIDIRSTGLNKDSNEWIYEWQVLVDTQPALISGNMAISFATVVSICMKAALSR